MHYQVGGSLTTDAPSYIARRADDEFASALRQGEFCYVLNSRQMGKSSLMVRAHQQFQQQGYKCAVLDMTNIGSENITPLQWYKGIVKDLWRSFRLTRKASFKFKDWWQDEEDVSLLQRLSQFIRDVLLTQFPDDELIIFVDEIDSILSLPFSIDDFFALIRFCYNQRAIDPSYKRIHFAIFGVATPADLIQNRSRTPFNIGKPIYLNGFTQAEAEPLSKGLLLQTGDRQAVLKAILSWTDGQPFLTQKLCQLAITSSQDAVSQPLIIPPGNEAYWVDELVRSLILNRWESQDEPEHLRTIRNRILNNPDTAGRLLSLYQQVLEGEVPTDDSREQVELLLSGLVHKFEGKLQVKNRIYGEIFNAEWIKQQLDTLRPYAQQLDAWAASAQTDESRLLRGQALKDAQQWVQGKQVSDLDYQYLAASVESDRKSTQQALEAQRLEAVEAQLSEEQARVTQEKKTLRFQRLLSGAVSAALLITLGLGFVALRQAQKAQVREVEALVSAARGSFDAHRQLEAVVQALQAYQKLKSLNSLDLSKSEAELVSAVKETLQNVIIGADEMNRFNFEAEVQDAVFSPSGEHIAVVTADGQLFLYQQNGALMWTIPAHAVSANAVAFSPDGQLIATASSDETVKLWQIDATPVSTTIRHTDTQPSESLGKLQFLPDGQSLIAAGQRTVGRWQIDGQQLMFTTVGSLRAMSTDGSFLVLLRTPNRSGPEAWAVPAPRALNPDVKGPNSKGPNSVVERSKSSGPLSPVSSRPVSPRPVSPRPSSPRPGSSRPGSPNTVRRAPTTSGSTVRLPNMMIVDLEGKELDAFITERGPVFSVAVSADNQLIATAGVDGAVNIWHRDGTFKQSLIGNKSDVREIAFSPDGTLLATAGDDKIIRLWQINGGLLKTFEGHRAEINKLMFSPDSQQLLSTSDDQTLRLWQVNEMQHQVLAGHGDVIRYLAFNDQGQLFSSSVDRWLNAWQRKGDRVVPIPIAQIAPGSPHPVGLSTNGKETVMAFRNGDIKIWQPKVWNAEHWQLEDFDPQQQLRAGTSLSGMDYSSNGEHLMTVTTEGELQHWQRSPSGLFPDAPTQLVKVGERPIEKASAIAISPNNKLVAVGSETHMLTLLKPDGSLIKSLSGHRASIHSVAFSPDGQWLATASTDRVLRLWPITKILSEDIDVDKVNSEVMEKFTTESTPVSTLAFSADSQLLISALTDGSLHFWDIANKELIRTLKGHDSVLEALAVSPDGHLVASAGRDRKIILWNLPEILSQNEVATACAWVQDYLTYNPTMELHRDLCSSQADGSRRGIY